MGKFPHVTRVILRYELRDRLPQIPEKPLRNLRALHDTPGDHGQEREQVVAAPVLEFLAHGRRPVLGPVFPAINVRRHQPATSPRPP